MAVVDVFVVLDCVDLPNQNSFVNRTRITLGGDLTWLTCSVRRPKGESQTIAETCFTDATEWRQKIVRKIAAAYHQHTFYDSVMAHLEPHIMNEQNSLLAYNLELIRAVRLLLSIDTPMLMASDLGCEGRSSELLANLTRRAKCDTYMHGVSGSSYQTPESFVRRSVVLRAQNFVQPQYPQKGSEAFIGGLSVLDALMNLGSEGTMNLLR